MEKTEICTSHARQIATSGGWNPNLRKRSMEDMEGKWFKDWTITLAGPLEGGNSLISVDSFVVLTQLPGQEPKWFMRI